MGSWFTKPTPQFEQRMPWVTSELIHDDRHLKGKASEVEQTPNEFAFQDTESSRERSLTPRVSDDDEPEEPVLPVAHGQRAHAPRRDGLAEHRGAAQRDGLVYAARGDALGKLGPGPTELVLLALPAQGRCLARSLCNARGRDADADGATPGVRGVLGGDSALPVRRGQPGEPDRRLQVYSVIVATADQGRICPEQLFEFKEECAEKGWVRHIVGPYKESDYFRTPEMAELARELIRAHKWTSI